MFKKLMGVVFTALLLSGTIYAAEPVEEVVVPPVVYVFNKETGSHYLVNNYYDSKTDTVEYATSSGVKSLTTVGVTKVEEIVKSITSTRIVDGQKSTDTLKIPSYQTSKPGSDGAWYGLGAIANMSIKAGSGTFTKGLLIDENNSVSEDAGALSSGVSATIQIRNNGMFGIGLMTKSGLGFGVIEKVDAFDTEPPMIDWEFDKTDPQKFTIKPTDVGSGILRIECRDSDGVTDIVPAPYTLKKPMGQYMIRAIDKAQNTATAVITVADSGGGSSGGSSSENPPPKPESPDTSKPDDDEDEDDDRGDRNNDGNVWITENDNTTYSTQGAGWESYWKRKPEVVKDDDDNSSERAAVPNNQQAAPPVAPSGYKYVYRNTNQDTYVDQAAVQRDIDNILKELEQETGQKLEEKDIAVTEEVTLVKDEAVAASTPVAPKDNEQRNKVKMYMIIGVTAVMLLIGTTGYLLIKKMR